MSYSGRSEHRNQNRGYSREFLDQPCPCGHARGAHMDRARSCFNCPCASFGDNHPLSGVLSGIIEQLEENGRRAQRVGVRVRRPDVTVAKAKESEARRCPFCHDGSFGTVPSLRCPSCKAWQHAECVSESRRRECGACHEEFPRAS